MRLFRLIPKKTFFFLFIFTFPSLAAGALPDPAQLGLAVETPLSGLIHEARIIRDSYGIAHIEAENDHDLYFLQGYVHAEDRLFQMDVSRRQAGGTLAELVGPAALQGDVQLRTIGLRRAAERSLAAISPRTMAVLTAYAEGVNAYVGAGNPLPPEYAALEISHFEPWTPLDSLSIAKLIAFDLSFDLDIGPTVNLYTYRETGIALGFDGVKLYEDLFRYAPFDSASTLPDAGASTTPPFSLSLTAPSNLEPEVLEMGKKYLDGLKENPLFKKIFDRDKNSGSNEWVISGALTENGVPLVANDPHLSLTVPSVFYPVHLKQTDGETDVIGNSFAGTPFVIIGHNRFISWGATVNPMDVTDVFREQLVPDPASPSGLSTVYQGNLEPVIPIPEVFRQNNPGNGFLDDLTVVTGPSIPAVTLIIPRRNNGPIIQFNPATGAGLSLQYTGFSPTRELDTFLIWDHATGLEDFKQGLQYFNFGSENLAYSDIQGNIAYFTSGEMPVREDLQAGKVNGLPPYFIRDGSGGNEWLPVQHPQPNQAGSYEILPFAEMPHVINPPKGWFVNANNDPVGTTFDNNPLNQLRPGGGIYYLNARYDGGFRAGRITELINQNLMKKEKISFKDMQEIQADTVMPDAEYFVTWIVKAFKRADANGADASLAGMAANPAVAEAVKRLKRWDFTSPTGIPEGYDAGRFRNGVISKPTPKEIASSVAATIYSVWRGRFIKNTIDVPVTAMNLALPDSHQSLSALRHLLDEFDSGHGGGSAGINFFNVPGIADPADQRDFLILKSVADSLNDLAGPAYAAAFGNSTRQDDYRWGKLHRVVLEHPLGGPFNIPPAGGAFPDSLPGLPGLSTDGGFGTVDRSSHDVRAGDVNAFMFNQGPANRYVSETSPRGVYAESSYPGGTSGILGNPDSMNLLPAWLWNDAFSLLFEEGSY